MNIVLYILAFCFVLSTLIWVRAHILTNRLKRFRSHLKEGQQVTFKRSWDDDKTPCTVLLVSFSQVKIQYMSLKTLTIKWVDITDIYPL